MKLDFRIWNKHNKRFETEYIDLLLSQDGELKEFITNSYEPYLSDNDDENNVIQFFTGVKDRNGNKIYDGDILKGKTDDYINGFLSPVDFYAGSFHVTITYDLHMIPLSGFDTVWLKNGCKGNEETSLWIDEFEVIGNIYEHANLLKREEKIKEKAKQ